MRVFLKFLIFSSLCSLVEGAVAPRAKDEKPLRVFRSRSMNLKRLRLVHDFETIINGNSFQGSRALEFERNVRIGLESSQMSGEEWAILIFRDFGLSAEGLEVKPAGFHSLYTPKMVQGVAIGAYQEHTRVYEREVPGNSPLSLRIKSTVGLQAGSKRKKSIVIKKVLGLYHKMQVRTKIELNVTGQEITLDRLKAYAAEIGTAAKLDSKEHEGLPFKRIGEGLADRRSLDLYCKGRRVGFLAVDELYRGSSALPEMLMGRQIEVEIFTSEVTEEVLKAAEKFTDSLIRKYNLQSEEKSKANQISGG